MTRLTRQQAAVRLGVSESTVDRMIRRGQLATEREHHGGRYTVWVLVDDETAYSGADETAQAELSSEGKSAYAKQPDADNSAYSDEHTAYPSVDELAVLRTENQALRELSDYHSQATRRVGVEIQRTARTAEANDCGSLKSTAGDRGNGSASPPTLVVLVSITERSN